MFYKNLIKILASSGISQILPLLLSPIIARLYSPENFGEYGVFMFAYSLLLVFSTGRLNNAISIARIEEDSNSLFLASGLILISTSSLWVIILFFFPNVLSGFLSSNLVFLSFALILVTLVSGAYEILLAIFNRKGLFNHIALSKILFSFSLIVTQVLLGYYDFGLKGLVIALITGKVVTVVFLLLQQKELFSVIKQISYSKTISSVNRYKNFLLFDIPSALTAVSLQQAPNYLFKIVYSTGFAGQFFFIQRLLQAPVTLVSGSVLEVFKNEALMEIKEHGSFNRTYLKTIRTLILITILPLIFGYLYIQEIVVFIYGQQWLIAGEIAQILMPVLALRLLANPLSFSFYLMEKQQLNFIILLTVLIFMIVAFFVGLEPLSVVKIISFILSLQYLFYLIYSFRLSKNSQ